MKKIKKLAMLLSLVMAFSILMIADTSAATIKINKTSVILIEDQKVTLKISGTKSKVTWKSSKKSVASVSSKGVVTANYEGTATITATVGKKTFKCKVTVIDPFLSDDDVDMVPGDTYQLSLIDTAKKPSITWKSSDTKIATVSSKGKVTAKSKFGKAKIKAKYLGKTFTCVINVYDLNKSMENLKEKINSSKKHDADGNKCLIMHTFSENNLFEADAIGTISYLEDQNQFKFVYQAKAVQFEDIDTTDADTTDATVIMYLNADDSRKAKMSVHYAMNDEYIDGEVDINTKTFGSKPIEAEISTSDSLDLFEDVLEITKEDCTELVEEAAFAAAFSWDGVLKSTILEPISKFGFTHVYEYLGL